MEEELVPLYSLPDTNLTINTLVTEITVFVNILCYAYNITFNNDWTTCKMPVWKRHSLIIVLSQAELSIYNK